MHTAALNASAQPDDDDGHTELRQYLTFSLGEVVFALGIESIKEILRNVHPATVPLMPAHVRGVINLRGAVVPVIDLALLFKRPALVVGKNTSIIVLELSEEGDTLEIGIMVDAVAAVIDIAAERIEPAPAFGTPVRSEFIEGIGKLSEGFVIILHAARTFALSQMVPAEAGDV